MAAQTQDEAARERCLRLEQTYLQLAKAEEQVVAQASGAGAFPALIESKPGL